MNTITLSGNVISMTNRKTKEHRVVNALLFDQEKSRVTFQTAFWDEVADYVQERIDIGDTLNVTGYIYQIKSNGYGPYIEIRDCQLIWYSKKDTTSYIDAATDMITFTGKDQNHQRHDASNAPGILTDVSAILEARKAQSDPVPTNKQADTDEKKVVEDVSSLRKKGVKKNGTDA